MGLSTVTWPECLAAFMMLDSPFIITSLWSGAAASHLQEDPRAIMGAFPSPARYCWIDHWTCVQ